jgi:ABC-2 type transport system permease protein
VSTAFNAAWRSVRRVAALATKELAHIRRDPQTLAMALGMPVALLLLFGYGVTFDLDHLPVVAVDQDRTHESRALVEAIAVSGDLIVGRNATEVAQGEAEMRAGHAVATIVVPDGFGRSVVRGEPADVQLVVDGADAATATQVINKADAIVGAALGSLSARRPPPLVVDTWTLYNPAGRSALMLVPGLMAFILAMVCVLLTALTVAREWERGSMEQLFTTPVRRGEIIVGKLLPYVALGVLAVLLVLAVGAWVFSVPMRGSLAALAVASLLFLMGMLAQGLFVSVVTKNQMVATQAATLSSMLPTLLLSGFVFPIANMPWALKAVAYVLPATHYVAALRAILLRGNGFSEVAVHLGALAAFTSVMVGVSTARFRRRLD